MTKSTHPKSVLLIITRQIGDVLLTTPLLHSMRMAWPTASIDVLLFDNTAGILEGNTDYNHIIQTVAHPSFLEYWQLIKRIFRRYDIAVTTLAGDRPHQYAFLAAPKRFGIVPENYKHGFWKRWLCSDWVTLDNSHTHTVTQYNTLAACMGIATYHQVVSPYDDNANKKLDSLLNFDWHTQACIVIHPFPMWQYKRWSDQGWHSLLNAIVESGKQVVITGGPADEERAYCEHLARNHPNNVISLAGKTSFAVMATLLKSAAAFVGPDTVATHLAAACGTPTLALFGPTNPVKWGPWPVDYNQSISPWINKVPMQAVGNVILLQGLGECVPCHKAGCEDHNNSYSQCLNELPAIRVIHALKVLLDNAQINSRKIIPICASS